MSIRVGKRIALGIVTLAVAAIGLASANLVLSGKSEAAGQGPFIFHANGDSAYLSITQPAVDADKWWSSCGVNLNVMRGGVGPATKTALSYSITVWDPKVTWFFEKEEVWLEGQCVPVQSGYGTIPNSAYRASAQSQQLNIDTSASIPGFTRDAGQGGVISIKWRKTGQWQSTRSGTSLDTYGVFSMRTTGTSTYSSASASGAIVGTPVGVPSTDPAVWADASIGSNSGVTICRPFEVGQDCGGK